MSDHGVEGFERHYLTPWRRNCALNYSHDDCPDWAQPFIYCPNRQQKQFFAANPPCRRDIPGLLSRVKKNMETGGYPPPVFLDDRPETDEQLRRTLTDAEAEAFSMKHLMPKRNRFLIWVWADLHLICMALDHAIDEAFWRRIQGCAS